MKLMNAKMLMLAGAMAFGLVGCGDKDNDTPTSGGPSTAAPAAATAAKSNLKGDVARGKDLYNQVTLGKKSAAGCASCHKYDESAGDQKKGPWTKGTATRAASRKPGTSAEDYIHESIVNPDAFLVEGFKKGDMYQKWATDLTEQEIADLVAYLATEK